MALLPSGTVTFLFTDIEGSTKLLQRLGEEYARALGGHQELLRAAFAAHEGAEVDTQGDAFFVAFAAAPQAAAAAADATRPLPAAATQALAALVERRRDVVEILTAERTRLATALPSLWPRWSPPAATPLSAPFMRAGVRRANPSRWLGWPASIQCSPSSTRSCARGRLGRRPMPLDIQDNCSRPTTRFPKGSDPP